MCKGASYWINKERKKSYAENANIYVKNESSIFEIIKKEKEIHANFSITPQTAKVNEHGAW